MKRMLFLGIVISSNLHAMETPAKKARTSTQEITSSFEIDSSQAEQSSAPIKNVVPALSQLTASSIIHDYYSNPTKPHTTAFPESFFILPTEMQQYLIAQPLPNRMGRTWLHEAKSPEDIDTFLLLASGYNQAAEQKLINQQDKLGNTALNSFLHAGRLDLAHHLLDNSSLVDAGIPNYKAFFPLHISHLVKDRKLSEKIATTIARKMQHDFLPPSLSPITKEADKSEHQKKEDDALRKESARLIQPLRLIIKNVIIYAPQEDIDRLINLGIKISERILLAKKLYDVQPLKDSASSLEKPLSHNVHPILQDLPTIREIDIFLDQLQELFPDVLTQTQMINVQDILGNTALNSFLHAGRLDLAHHLLDQSPLVDASLANKAQTHPFTLALLFNDIKLAKKIVDAVIRKNKNFCNIQKDLDIFETLKKAFDDDIVETITPAKLALIYKMPQLLKILYTYAIRPVTGEGSDENPFILLMQSFDERRTQKTEEIITYLLENNYDINSRGARNQNILMELIESMNFDEKENDYKPLSIATQKLVRFLISKGLDSNAQDRKNQTALIYAASRNPFFIPVLIELGADETLKRTKITMTKDNVVNTTEQTALDILEEYFPQFVDMYHESLAAREGTIIHEELECPPEQIANNNNNNNNE